MTSSDAETDFKPIIIIIIVVRYIITTHYKFIAASSIHYCISSINTYSLSESTLSIICPLMFIIAKICGKMAIAPGQ